MAEPGRDHFDEVETFAMKTKPKPKSPAPLAFTIDGQPYQEVGTVPYLTRFDREIRLVRLATRCPICERGFEVTATRTAAKRKKLVRRCPEHRVPGWPVARHRAVVQARAERAHAAALMAMFD